MTDYERSKMLRVQENQERLRVLGVKNIDKSLTSLAVAENRKKRQKKGKVTNDKDVEYNSEDASDSEENYQEVATHVTAPKGNQIRNIFIVTNFYNFSLYDKF